MLPLKEAAKEIAKLHDYARETLQEQQKQRWAEEEQKRHSRMPKGLIGFLYRITGKHHRIRLQNEQETELCLQRDETEQQEIAMIQAKERWRLQEKINAIKEENKETLQQLRRDIGDYKRMLEQDPDTAAKFLEKRKWDWIYDCGPEMQ